MSVKVWFETKKLVSGLFFFYVSKCKTIKFKLQKFESSVTGFNANTAVIYKLFTFISFFVWLTSDSSCMISTI